MITSPSHICLSFQGTGSMYEELWGSHTQRSRYKRYDGYLQRISQSKIKETYYFSLVQFSFIFPKNNEQENRITTVL